MDIPAKQIVEQLEEQLEYLKRAIDDNQSGLVKEKAAVIEAYCQLLKGTNAGRVEQKEVITQQVRPIAQVQSYQGQEEAVVPPKSSLLDF